MNIKYQKRIFLFFGVLFFFFDNKSLVGAFLDGKTFFFPRSDHSKVMATRENAYHSLFFKGKAGEQEYFSKKGRPFADVVFSCNHSFGSDDIASYFFGQDKLIFSGSRSASRQSTHILSDYFGTTSDFQSTVSFSPVVRSASVCFSTGIGLEALCKKLYAKITLPFVYKSFDMRLKENVTSQGINSHPAGYMSGGNQPLSKTVLVHNIKTAFKGEQSFGDMRTPLQYGKIDGVQKKFSCADITIEVFRKIINKRKKQLDVYIKGVIPTASSADARYLFEPIVGSNDHWQLGLGMSGSYFCLENEEKERKVQLCADFELLHLFSSKQKRSFDLKNNGFGSRYMLMQEFNSFSDGVFSVPGSVPYQYSGSLLPVINKTTLDCRVKVAVQADLLLNCIYFYKERWKINGGYNLWMRSSEKIYNRKLFKNDVYGLKGDTQMYGFFTNTVDVAVPLNATQSEATLCKAQGSGNLRQTLLANDFANANVDNPALVSELATPGTLNHLTGDDITTLGVAGPLQTRGSNNPILLQDSDIDEQSAEAPFCSSHTFFVAADYCWPENRFKPLLGGGLKIECAGTHDSKKGVFSRFGLWVNAGITI